MAEELCTGWFRIVAGMRTSLSLFPQLSVNFLCVNVCGCITAL